MTPLEKSDGVVNKNKDKFTRRLIETHKLLELPRGMDFKAERMIEIIDELGALVAPATSCKKGCSHCCYQAVIISTWEAERISKYAKRKTTGFKGHTKTIKHIQKQFRSVICPFLENDICTIYQVRPFMCRAHYNMSDDPNDCDIALKPNTVVPYFNFESYKMAWVLLFIEDNYLFGDIREFFKS
jgi:Fe-S-cluster containining protein